MEGSLQGNYGGTSANAALGFGARSCAARRLPGFRRPAADCAGKHARLLSRRNLASMDLGYVPPSTPKSMDTARRSSITATAARLIMVVFQAERPGTCPAFSSFLPERAKSLDVIFVVLLAEFFRAPKSLLARQGLMSVLFSSTPRTLLEMCGSASSRSDTSLVGSCPIPRRRRSHLPAAQRPWHRPTDTKRARSTTTYRRTVWQPRSEPACRRGDQFVGNAPANGRSPRHDKAEWPAWFHGPP